MTSFLAIILLALLAWIFPPWLRDRRRRRLRARGLAREQVLLLEQSLPIYRSLTPAQQAELRANMSLFLRDKEFVGCGGLRVTEAMRVTVAAHACLLLLGRENRCYPSLHTVLLYPDTYVAPETWFDGAVETIGESVREGESWHRGPVVLSWADLEQDLQHPEQGRNLVLHEFAHKLDEEDGIYNGRPVFAGSDKARQWTQVFNREFGALQALAEDEELEEYAVLDPYGAESPAEFFAVATEAFFVIPDEMQQGHPQLYEALCSFYRLDPATWRHQPGSRNIAVAIEK